MDCGFFFTFYVILFVIEVVTFDVYLKGKKSGNLLTSQSSWEHMTISLWFFKVCN